MSIASVQMIPLKGNIRSKEVTVGDPFSRSQLRHIIDAAREKKLVPRSMRVFINGNRVRPGRDDDYTPRHHIVNVVLVERPRRRKRRR